MRRALAELRHEATSDPIGFMLGVLIMLLFTVAALGLLILIYSLLIVLPNAFGADLPVVIES